MEQPFFEKDDIRFNYSLGGGALMDMGRKSIDSVSNGWSEKYTL